MAKAKELVDAGNTIVIGDRGWKGGEITVDGEAEWAADGRDAADDIGAVNGGCIPCVCSNMGGFRADLGVAGALVGSNGNGLVEEAKEAFNRDRLMVAAEAGLAR